MQFSVLGRLAVHDGSAEITVRGVRLRSLLALLLLHANEPIATDRVQDALWNGRPPASGAAAVHNLVARLRRVLSEDMGERLSMTPLGYLLKVADGELDCELFERHVDRARTAFLSEDWGAVRDETAAALDLWRGEPLAELADLHEARAQREQWTEIRLQALEWHFDAQLNLGEHQGISADLAALAVEHPYREAFHRQLMIAFYRTERTAQALEVYSALRRALAEELGIDPSGATQEAHREILTSGSGAAPSSRPVRKGSSRTAPVASASLPRDIRSFTGRREELDLLLAACRSGAAAGQMAGIHAVDGMPGVGKSAFAIHCAHRIAADFPDGQIFMPLHAHTPGTPAIEPADALATLLLAIGVAPQQIPSDPTARAGLWRSQLAGKRMLVLFDDARGSEQVKPLLPGASGTLVLITSRRRLVGLEDAIPITLNVLPPQEAAQLFTATAGRADLQPGDPALAEIVRLCGYLPLAIQLTAGRLRHHPAWAVADLIPDLTAATGRLDSLSAETASVAATFNLSYRNLEPDLQRLFRRLGLNPGDDLDAHAAAALDGTDVHTARRRLEMLEDHHLIDEPVRGRYQMHDLIREHARALADADESTARAAAVDRLLDLLLASANTANRQLARYTPAETKPPVNGPDLSTPALATAWLRTERANLHAAVEFAAVNGRPQHAVRLPAAMHEFLRGQGHWQQAHSLHQIALDTALRIGDQLGEADSLTNRGIVRLLIGQAEPSSRDLLQALERYRELGMRSGQAHALSSLAQTLYLSGRFTEAAEMLRDALAVYQELDDRLGESHTLVTLGHVLQLSGRRAEAVEHLQPALELCRALGNLLGQANALYSLGLIGELTGPYAKAAAHHREAIELFQGLGNSFGSGNALSALGMIERLMGNYKSAEACYHHALELHRTLGSQLGQANALADLGRLRRAAGRYADAADATHAALELHRAIGDRRGEAVCLVALGGIEHDTGRHAEAVATLNEALTVFRALDFGLGEGRALAQLGDTQRALGRYDDAAETLRRSVELCREAPDLGSEAQARNILGHLLAETGKPEDARAQHTKALELARIVGSPLHEAHALAGLGEPENALAILHRLSNSSG